MQSDREKLIKSAMSGDGGFSLSREKAIKFIDCIINTLYQEEADLSPEVKDFLSKIQNKHNVEKTIKGYKE